MIRAKQCPQTKKTQWQWVHASWGEQKGQWAENLWEWQWDTEETEESPAVGSWRNTSDDESQPREEGGTGTYSDNRAPVEFNSMVEATGHLGQIGGISEWQPGGSGTVTSTLSEIPGNPPPSGSPPYTPTYPAAGSWGWGAWVDPQRNWNGQSLEMRLAWMKGPRPERLQAVSRTFLKVTEVTGQAAQITPITMQIAPEYRHSQSGGDGNGTITITANATANNTTVKESVLPMTVDIRQPESAPPVPPATASNSGSTGIQTQDDDFAVVSNGTDPDLASEVVISIPSGVTGTFTANLRMKGNDGALLFEQSSMSIVPGTPKATKFWGTTSSSGENMSKVEIELGMPDGSKSSLEEDLTIIDGVKISFEGTFYSPVDSRAENWRPSTRAKNTRGVDDAPAVIAADVSDFTSNISFTDGDQPVSYRAWSPKPKVTVSKVEAINPPMELKKDPLKGAEVHMTSGAFQHAASAIEKIENPNLVFKTSSVAPQTFFSTSIVNRLDDRIDSLKKTPKRVSVLREGDRMTQ